MQIRRAHIERKKKKKSFTNTLINLGFNLLPEFAN